MYINYKIEHEICEDDFVIIEVCFEASAFWQDDSFYFEQGDVRGTHRVPVYADIDGDITWDKTFHSDNENSIIASFLENENNYSIVEQLFIDKFIDNCRKDY